MLSPRRDLSFLHPYTPGKSIAEIKEVYKLENVIKLASNENPLGLSPLAKEVFKNCADDLSLYPRGNAPELTKAISEKHKIPENCIITGNGSDEVLDMAARAFLKQGDVALGSKSTFSVYETATVLAGASYIKFSLKDWFYPIEYLAASAEREKAKIIFICNPNNPTGIYIPQKKIEEYLAKVPQDVLIILDHAYIEFTGDDISMPSLIDRFPNVLCTRTFSKLYGLAGLRIGYGIGSPQVITAVKKAKPPFNANYPAQMAAAAAISDSAFVEKSLKMVSEGRERLSKELAALGFEVLPSGANFVCVHTGANTTDMVVEMESRGLILRQLASFEMPEWTRITIGTPEQNDFVLQLFSELKGKYGK